MKKSGFAVLALAAMAFTGCDKGGDITSEIDYIPVQVEEDGEWQFINKDGVIAITDGFKEKPSLVVNGVFSVKEDNKICLYKVEKDKPVAIKGCEELVDAGAFSGGLIPVTFEDSRITLVDGDGNKKFTLDPFKGKEIVRCQAVYQSGLLAVKTQDDKWGYVDSKGKGVIEPVYDEVSPFVGDYAMVGETPEGSDEQISVLINKKGEKLVKLRKGWSVMRFQEGNRFFVRDNNDNILIMDNKGETVKCPSRVKTVYAYNDKFYVFTNDSYEAGVMDYEGNVVLRAKYDSVILLPDGRIAAHDDKDIIVYDAKGEKLYELEDYRGLEYLPGLNALIARDKRTYQLYDMEGKEIKDASFSDINTGSFGDVASDYFNLENVVKDVMDNVQPDGYKNVKFGATAAQVLKGIDMSDVPYGSSVDMNAWTVEGYRYTVKAAIGFNKSVTTYDSEYNRILDPESKVLGFIIRTTCEKEIGLKGLEAFRSAFKSKGFKVDLETKENADSAEKYVLMTKGDLSALIVAMEDGSWTNVVYFKDKDSRDIFTRQIQQRNGTVPEEVVAESEPDSDEDGY